MNESFVAWLDKVRAGDQAAAADLVRQYEPLVRRMVRLRLEDRGLCRVFDSMDVCQSVMASFFVRAAAGQYDLHNAEQLTKLLVTMARNHLISAARRQRQQKRDHRRLAPADSLERLASRESSPSQRIAGEELLSRLRQELSEEEQRIGELRRQGLDWAGIAAEMGGTPQARRMQLARAFDRVTRALGLEEEGRCA